MLTSHAIELQLVAHRLLLRLVRHLLLFPLVHPNDLGALPVTDGILMRLLLYVTQAWLLVIRGEDRRSLPLKLATVYLHLTTDDLLSLVGKLDGTACEGTAISL